ncbi:DUF1992 domain-containing protein [Anaerobacillus sp. CMMVII]|uniref:DUF1992 domain-containing protein n=1 Tax=Anaerobacillus sp. CMMVII TaxID=2755588 RepID=UPI0021B77ED3|nr:DUF1992 domain-containing protein [Anaerobacillus sp. CMMVII]MCT8138183.1 DUF1992 domain-containing protein [Anaerobacillus sp. CMMVII]
MSRDWLGDMINRDEKLKGMGKPLSREVLEGNVLDRTIKNAGYVPQWIAIQQDVRDRLGKIILLLETPSETDQLNQEIAEINILVKKYNSLCPTPMQKMLISLDQAKSQIKSWE